MAKCLEVHAEDRSPNIHFKFSHLLLIYVFPSRFGFNSSQIAEPMICPSTLASNSVFESWNNLRVR